MHKVKRFIPLSLNKPSCLDDPIAKIINRLYYYDPWHNGFHACKKIGVYSHAWFCTREAGHEGMHVAHGRDETTGRYGVLEYWHDNEPRDSKDPT